MEEEADFIEKFEEAAKDYTVDYIRKLFKDINTNLLRKFNKSFKHDDKGNLRNWVALEKGQIDDLWNSSKAKADAMFRHFKFIPVEFDFRATPTAGKFTMKNNDSNIVEEEKELSSARRATTGNQFPRLLSEADINRVRDRFNQDTETALDEAKRRQSPGDGNIPAWFYLIFIYFAYDDVLRMCMNPLLFYPMILVVSMLGLLYSMGLGPVMFPMLKGTINMWLRSCKIPIQL